MLRIRPLAGLVAGAAMLVTSAHAADYTIRFHVSPAPDQPAALAAERFAEAVETRSEGRIEVNVYPSEQLGGEPDAMQNVRIGGIQLAFMSPGAIGNLLPDFLILNGPFLWKDWETAQSVLNGPFGETLFEELRTQSGIRVLDPLWYWGWREMTADKPIRTPADLQGLKMRSPNIPVFVEMFRALGANPTTINFQEIYSALQQGVVDGQENPIPAIWSQRFYEVNPYISMTNHILQTNVIIANEMWFQSLPDDLKTIVEEEIVAAGQYNTELQMQAERDLVAQIEAAGGTIVEDVDREAFREATQSIYTTLADSWTEGLYDRLQDAIAEANPN
ncbi:TRAP transporter substrate-binding protein [Acuticoccus sp. M5D2P5]|uniref:TRAP transporter substrate-binding protein n=1 Tax=Acuticoccus kalidii TaxID=2910977 RepID=UPI001F2F6ECD|nr:TRAP transporter substrate-binding protein [Acuticoccus kalidii]MCF3935252.1 TRAP transporter substrate-binding protein [Acuticoccus kalidii]